LEIATEKLNSLAGNPNSGKKPVAEKPLSDILDQFNGVGGKGIPQRKSKID